MDAICKHEPLYCTLHCHLDAIFVLFIQYSVNKLQKGKSPQTCLCEAVGLHTSDTKQHKTESYCRMGAFKKKNVTIQTCITVEIDTMPMLIS